jgi:hypothetical protein
MKCKICNKSFKRRVVIDGKLRNLSRRVHCLECVPFDNKSASRRVENTLICENCKQEFLYHKGRTTLTKCKSCRVPLQSRERKLKCIEYLGGKCEVCGYDKCVNVLSFHHVNPDAKSFPISGNYTRKWSILMAELDKCRLLCSNCHGELHHEALI